MDSLSIICIAVGFLVIVKRGPLMFAPRATLRFYDRWLLSTNARFRVVGVVGTTLAMALLFSDLGEGVLARLVHTLGRFVATVALLFLVLPNVFRGFIQTILVYIEKSVDESIMRIVGFLHVLFGLALIYVGVYVV
jgi:uncharacterized protein YjeT (DUF2065 family)